MPAKLNLPDKKCLHCLKTFGRNSTKSVWDYKQKKFCSQVCYFKYNKGSNHFGWRGGVKTRPDGYLRDGKTDKYIHRLVMEKHLGRKLKTEEHIHHIDGNPKNNNINNLKIMSNSEHRKLEAKIAPKAHGKFLVKDRPKKIALVIGATGQDSSYMLELLLESGLYDVHGTIRRSSTPNTKNITQILKRITTHLADLSDATSISNVIAKIKPDLIFNLAAQSDVRASYDIPLYTGDVTGLGFTRILEAARQHCPYARIYQAGSSEMFGKVQAIPQSEHTPFYPRSPYGAAKVYAFSMGRAYREGYGMRIYNGILFNHESPRRGELFVTKKIVKAAVNIKLGKQAKLKLGNLEAKRDFGYSKEYMEIIYEFVTTQEPQDFVVATGETHTIEEWVKETFEYLGLGDYKKFVEFDANLLRPAEVDLLIGDASKMKRLLNRDVKVKFKDLIHLMIDEELKEHETPNL